jgi:hypothetical protein
MQPITHGKISGLGSSALRLSASLLSMLVFCAAALAQTGPTLTLNSPVSIFDYIRQNINTTSAGRVATLSNSGTSSLTITSVTVTGLHPTNFLLSANGCNGAVLAPGATCNVTVSFRPTATGVRSARLTVTDNAAGSQHLIPLTGIGLNPAVPNRDIGPIDPRVGYPLWQQDDQGVRLQLCLDTTNNLCLSQPPNPAQPPSVKDGNINFPGEAFWWSGEAEIDLPGGGRARLVLAKEAAFTTEEATVGQQIAFDRVRVRLDEVTPNTTYTVTHPFGTMTVVSDEDGEVDETEDIGCGSSPCDFRIQFKGKIGVFLRWDPAVTPLAPVGYLGDPNIPHTVIGSPLNTNFFRVVGPNIGGNGVNTIQTNLFAISGKLFQ